MTVIPHLIINPIPITNQCIFLNFWMVSVQFHHFLFRCHHFNIIYLAYYYCKLSLCSGQHTFTLVYSIHTHTLVYSIHTLVYSTHARKHTHAPICTSYPYLLRKQTGAGRWCTIVIVSRTVCLLHRNLFYYLDSISMVCLSCSKITDRWWTVECQHSDSRLNN